MACAMSPGRWANSWAASFSHAPIAVPPLACRRSTARMAAARGAADATASAPGSGKSCWAVLTPAMMAKWTPSSMQLTATLAACRAAAIRPSACIDPDASTMMISVAPAVRRPVSLPDEATVTIALTSVAPRARNSFWNASAVYGTGSPLSACGNDGNQGGAGIHDGNQRDGDVVRAAALVRVRGERTGGGQRVGVAQMLADGVGEVDRIGEVVPQAVAAQHHVPGGARGVPPGTCLRRARVGAQPGGDRMRLGIAHGVARVGAQGDRLGGPRVVLGELLGRPVGGQPVRPAVADPAVPDLGSAHAGRDDRAGRVGRRPARVATGGQRGHRRAGRRDRQADLLRQFAGRRGEQVTRRLGGGRGRHVRVERRRDTVADHHVDVGAAGGQEDRVLVAVMPQTPVGDRARARSGTPLDVAARPEREHAAVPAVAVRTDGVGCAAMRAGAGRRSAGRGGLRGRIDQRPAAGLAERGAGGPLVGTRRAVLDRREGAHVRVRGRAALARSTRRIFSGPCTAWAISRYARSSAKRSPRSSAAPVAPLPSTAAGTIIPPASVDSACSSSSARSAASWDASTSRRSISAAAAASALTSAATEGCGRTRARTAPTCELRYADEVPGTRLYASTAPVRSPVASRHRASPAAAVVYAGSVRLTTS